MNFLEVLAEVLEEFKVNYEEEIPVKYVMSVLFYRYLSEQSIQQPNKCSTNSQNEVEDLPKVNGLDIEVRDDLDGFQVFCEGELDIDFGLSEERIRIRDLKHPRYECGDVYQLEDGTQYRMDGYGGSDALFTNVQTGERLDQDLCVVNQDIREQVWRRIKRG